MGVTRELKDESLSDETHNLMNNLHKDKTRTQYLLNEQSLAEPETYRSKASLFTAEQPCNDVESSGNKHNLEKCDTGDGIRSPRNEEEKKGNSLNFLGMPRKDKGALLLLMACHFTHTVGYSLMAPFFPVEAKKKGVSATVTGFIFSCFELCVFITSPFVGLYLTRIGVNFAFSAGLAIAGVSTILFGLLNYASADAFVPLCFVVRSVEAMSISLYTVASYSIASKNFQHCISQVFGLMETCLGIGMMIGPVFGSLLYEAGGYGLPFYLLGSWVLVMGLLTIFFFPTQDYPVKEPKQSRWYLFRSGRVWSTILTICASAYALGFLNPSLSLHAEEMDISSAYVGFLFIIDPVLYAISSPLWGWLSDKKNFKAPLMIVGNLFCGVAFLLMGPTPFLPFLPSATWLLIVGLALNGIFVGCALIPTFVCLMKGAEEVGFEDNMETFAMVSGLHTTFFCSGSFFGPFTGGILVDHFGFDYSVNVVALLNFIAMMLTIGYNGWRHWKDRPTGNYVTFPEARVERSIHCPRR